MKKHAHAQEQHAKNFAEQEAMWSRERQQLLNSIERLEREAGEAQEQSQREERNLQYTWESERAKLRAERDKFKYKLVTVQQAAEQRSLVVRA